MPFSVAAALLLLAAALLGYLLATYVADRRFRKTLSGSYVGVAAYDLLADELRAERDERQASSIRASAEHARLDTRLELLTAQLCGPACRQNRERLAGLEAERGYQAEQQQFLRKQLTDQAEATRELQAQAALHFEAVAQRLLEEKGANLVSQQQTSLQHLLAPLRSRLGEFQQQIDQKFVRETEEKAGLKVQIEQLHALNQQLSADAKLLTRALKGDSKVQGDWGELRLERLLQSAGLMPEVHYTTQVSLRSADGRLQRPDCLVHLPDERHLVIDSKVSLTAFERFCADPDAPEAPEHLRLHTVSLRAHVKGLGHKAYQELYAINSPDYVLLFVPIEPAFALACQHDPQLFEEALRANVVIVSPSTLLATMRTVAYLWRQDDQRANAEEIAALGGRLYDKFVGFVEEMRNLKTHLGRADEDYDKAVRRLSDGAKPGATLIGQAERLRELGVTARRRLDKEALAAAGSPDRTTR